jgi:isopentenyl-diphosphate delta-isomerase
LAEALRQSVDEVVSSEDDELILVDEHDREVGTLAKGACHDGEGVLHRAFSLFVFNPRGELLLQRRSEGKRLWPGYWSNSCCSHPRAGETMDEATHRRLVQELGMRSALRYLFKFFYHARYGEVGSERELCWVYAGISLDEVRANANEIADWRWIAPDRLDREMSAGEDVFTPWFRLEWARIRRLSGAVPKGKGGL